MKKVILPDTAAAADFVAWSEARNADPDVAAIIVQSPPPARLTADGIHRRPGKPGPSAKA